MKSQPEAASPRCIIIARIPRRRLPPYFSYDEVKNEYEKVAHLIPDYNQWDFAVTMNLVYSNHIDLVRKWSRSEDSVIHKITDLSVSFLCDEDTNHPTDKIFWYMTAG